MSIESALRTPLPVDFGDLTINELTFLKFYKTIGHDEAIRRLQQAEAEVASAPEPAAAPDPIRPRDVLKQLAMDVEAAAVAGYWRERAHAEAAGAAEAAFFAAAGAGEDSAARNAVEDWREVAQAGLKAAERHLILAILRRGEVLWHDVKLAHFVAHPARALNHADGKLYVAAPVEGVEVEADDGDRKPQPGQCDLMQLVVMDGGAVTDTWMEAPLLKVAEAD